MSWNLRIYKPGTGPSASELIGSVENVSGALQKAFPGLEGDGNQYRVPGEGACSIVLATEGGVVNELRTVGDWEHLERVAPLCKQRGWRMALIDEGKDLDVDFYALCWEKRHARLVQPS